MIYNKVWLRFKAIMIKSLHPFIGLCQYTTLNPFPYIFKAWIVTVYIANA